MRTFADITEWSQRRMLRTFTRYSIDQHAFQTGCSRYSHSLRSFLGQESSKISENALKRADVYGLIYGAPSGLDSYSPLLAETVRWRLPQTAQAEAQGLIQNPLDEGEVSRILAEYRNWSVQFPYDKVHNAEELKHHLQLLLDQIAEKREGLRLAILELDALSRKVWPVSDPGMIQELKDRASKIRQLRDEVSALITTLNPVLNIAEEIRCRPSTHPSALACRKMEL